MKRLLVEHLRKPHGILIRPAGAVCLLLAALWAVNSLGLQSAEQRRAELSAQWAQARKEHQQHQAARRAKQDLAQVWAALPEERDFAPLALGITEEAKQNHVTLPALSYKTESTPVATMKISGGSCTTSKRPTNWCISRTLISCRRRPSTIISRSTSRL